MGEFTQSTATSKAARSRGAYSLQLILALAFGSLVAVSVGAVLLVSVGANFRNTYSLLNERAILLITRMEQAIRQETARSEQSVTGLAKMFSSEGYQGADPANRIAAMRAILATDDSIEGLAYIGADGRSDGLIRNRAGGFSPLSQSSLPALSVLVTGESQTGTNARWGEPFLIDGAMFHNVSAVSAQSNVINGAVIAILGSSTISEVISTIGRNNDATVFVLNAANEIIGHSVLTELLGKRNSIPLVEIEDEALQQMPNAVSSDYFQRAAAQGISVKRSPGLGGWIYITRTLPGYSGKPYTFGAYFGKDDIGEEIKRAMFSLFAGLAGLAAAVIAAATLGKWISAPMARIASTAGQLSDFQIDDIEPLPRSSVKEIDNQTVALNRMHVAIGEFSKYVPRTLVSRLVKLGASASMSVEKEVTVLFTDIAGFTTLSEHLNASQTASLLNEHFDIICPLIESCGGTVDKFMGDGVMAFWGAPEDDSEHVARAVGAARKIVEAMHVHNLANHKAGLLPVRIRIGIHTGPAIVGNIGGGGRQNYTLVGDTVNVAQRLEQMGHQIMREDEEALVLVSSPVVAATKALFSFKPTGTHTLRGRARPVAIFKLALAGNAFQFHGKRRPRNKVAPLAKV